MEEYLCGPCKFPGCVNQLPIKVDDNNIYKENSSNKGYRCVDYKLHVCQQCKYVRCLRCVLKNRYAVIVHDQEVRELRKMYDIHINEKFL
jgi:hypothetical protein